MAIRRALMLDAPGITRIAEEPMPELGPDDVLVRSVLSTIKHGSEMTAYTGKSPFIQKNLDLDLRVFVAVDDAGPNSFFPRPLGNMTVGVVEEIGARVSRVSESEHVYGWLPVADWHVAAVTEIERLGDLSPEQALCIDPAFFALGAVLDGNVGEGETVLVTGLGSIGLLAVQYCKNRGATVYASSAFSKRCELAGDFGAVETFDLKSVEDLGLLIKQRTRGGVDVAIECSGSYAKLHQAIRATRQCGRVVCVGFYLGPGTDLNLGEEFFHNRISLLASLPAFRWNNPVRGSPPLYGQDLRQHVIDDILGGRLKVESLLQPTYPFTQVEEAIDAIKNQPEKVIKVAIHYGAPG